MFFFCFSGTKRASAADAARGTCTAWPVRTNQRRPGWRPQQPPLPLLLHITITPSRALPNLALWPVRPAHQRHGHRQHLRACSEATLLRCRMGAKHPLLPRPPGHRPGRVTTTRVVGVIRPERISVLDAAPRGAAVSRRGPARFAHGGGPCGRLHGPHTNLPRASGEAESAPRGLGGVLLSEGDRPLHDR